MRNNKKNKKLPYIRKGAKIRGWLLVKVLGRGGNGEVWEVAKDGFENHAIKVLVKPDNKSYERFKAEVYILSKFDLDGLIRIKDSYLPEKIDVEKPWFLMSKAEGCNEFLSGKSSIEIVKEFLLLSKTLVCLHGSNISHRDIKPANILALNSRLCFADFGLVKYPGKADVTSDGRDVGAKYTMAPEMRRNPEQHDGRAADVYSLAKSLWIMLTKIRKGFDGQYVPSSSLSIKKVCSGLYVTSLENLLVKSTDNEPSNRPSASEFTEELARWLEINTDIHSRGVQQWIDLHKIIFPLGAPDRASWSDLDSICSVLNEVGMTGRLNHMFYPDGGGMDLFGASKAREDGMMNIHIGDSSRVDIVKPKTLYYESFGLDHSWNYFRLELDVVEPIFESQGCEEYLLELEPGVYVERHFWELGEYNGKSLPSSARPVCRFTSGAFVIFGKRSIYNLATGRFDAYDGRHNKMGAEDFRAFIENFAVQCTQSGLSVHNIRR